MSYAGIFKKKIENILRFGMGCGQRMGYSQDAPDTLVAPYSIEVFCVISFT